MGPRPEREPGPKLVLAFSAGRAQELESQLPLERWLQTIPRSYSHSSGTHILLVTPQVSLLYLTGSGAAPACRAPL